MNNTDQSLKPRTVLNSNNAPSYIPASVHINN